MTNKEIIEQIFLTMESFDEFHVKISQKVFGNGYFLFELGDDSVCHFKVKGLRLWKFGIWCEWFEKEGYYRISLFGEHCDYIDKFKPTATEISYEFNWDGNGVIPFETIYNFTEELYKIRQAKIARKYQYYGYGEGLVKFTIEDFLEYRIKKAFNQFKVHHLMQWHLLTVGKIYEILFKRKNNNFHVDMNSTQFFYPLYEFKIIYDKCDEDTMDKIYHIVERKDRNGYRKCWLMPKWVMSKIRVSHHESNEDKRGFYYKDKEDDE